MHRSLFALKPLSELQGEPQARRAPSLNAWSLTLLGVGCIMGTGIFVLTGQVAASHAGPAVVLSFVLAALTAALGAMCYAEMAAMLPVAGSGYVYAYATMGELPAFLMGWVLCLEYLVGAATVGGGWAGYAGALAEHLGLPTLPTHLRQAPIGWDAATGGFVLTGHTCNLGALLVVLAIGAALFRGTREASRLNAIIVFIKLLVVMLFLACAVPHVRPALWHPFIPPNTGTFGAFGASGVLEGATALFFAYLGFDAVSVAAGETRRPQTDVPIGILASLAICAVLYVATAAALTGLVPYTQLGVSHPMALGVQAMGLGWLETFVEVGALAGLTSVLLVQLFAQPRIALAMARDGFLPRFLCQVHHEHGTPQRITLLTTAACALCAGFLPVDVLAEVTSIGTLLAFAMVGLGVIILRYRRPDWPRKFRVPGGAWAVPGLCLASSGALMATASRASFAYLLGWVALGVLLYLTWGRASVSRMLQQRPRHHRP